MCQRRARKIVKGSEATQQREARRRQRMRMPQPPSSDEASAAAPAAPAKSEQKRFMLDLAWRTVMLMHKNRLIQRKILDLQKETSDFITAVMDDPEVSRRDLPPFLRQLSYSELQSLRIPSPDAQCASHPVKFHRFLEDPDQSHRFPEHPAQSQRVRSQLQRISVDCVSGDEGLNVVD